jgi:uncharacterized repeat protein (TIGR03803 family)
MKNKTLLFLIGLCLLALPVRAQTALLHEFTGGADDGKYPWGDLIVSGSTLYGMTQNGGSNDKGTIFSVQADGSGFTLLHEFAGSSFDGQYPLGSLIMSDTTLYGMTQNGGNNDRGMIFKIQTDGSGFTLLHAFAGDASEGVGPNGSLIIQGSTLFGMTNAGGMGGVGGSWGGTIFKIQIDGSDFTMLYSFDSYQHPYGALTLEGSTLYGMTQQGGSNDYGTIFKIQTDGSDYTLLHQFTLNDGTNPRGSLILSGTTLYGMTAQGGNSTYGTIFKIDTDGTGFSLLHEFTGGADDGARPYGSLILSGSILYGMTYFGNDGNLGTIFMIETNGSKFSLLHKFTGGVDDGAYPYGSLILSGSTLLGMTRNGGDNDMGTVFSLPLPSSITVTSPNGGEQWQRGITQTITWTSVGVTNVKIQLMKGTAVNSAITNSTITNSTPAAGGSYSWTIPAAQAVAANYKIRVISKESSAVQDSSNANFTIFAPSITVTAPAAGGVWTRNTIKTITWTTMGTMAGSVKIQLYKGTTKKLDIILSTDNDGAYDWLIPATLAKGTYTICITTVDNKFKGKSGAFSIVLGI